MAQEDSGEERHYSTPTVGSGVQTVLIVVVLVATVGLVYLMQYTMHLDTMRTILYGAIVVVLIGFFITWLAITYRKHEISRDGKATCDPILERFERTHNANKLISDYDAWCKKGHDAKLVYTFTKATVEELIDTHHYKQARRQLKLLSQMPATPRTREEYERFNEECQKRMSGK